MSKRLQVELELPDDLVVNLQDEEIVAKAKEAFFMELLREHRISQGRTAELLGITRHELFDLLSKYQVPAIDLTVEELRAELDKTFADS
jgi:predicted HTH domain antitoxin